MPPSPALLTAHEVTVEHTSYDDLTGAVITVWYPAPAVQSLFVPAALLPSLREKLQAAA